MPKLSNTEIFTETKIDITPIEIFEKGMNTMVATGKKAPINTPMHSFIRLWENNTNKEILQQRLCILCATSDDNSISSIPIQVPETFRIGVEMPDLGQHKYINVFIDYSNITANLAREDGKHPIVPSGLFSVIKQNGLGGDRHHNCLQITGSFPESSHPVWREWQQLGFSTRIARQGKEDFVDDSIHAQIARLLLQKGDPQILVLVTGDGNSNKGYSNFPGLVQNALDRGWIVEIYSWKNRLNYVYPTLAGANPRQMRICKLDDFKDKILSL